MKKIDGLKSIIGGSVMILGTAIGVAALIFAPESKMGERIILASLTVGGGMLGIGIADKVRKLTEAIK